MGRCTVGEGKSMKLESLIPASWFYMDESGKNKFNWFLYEFACYLFEHIESCKGEALAKWKAQRSEGQIAEFCAYFSKRMRQSVLDRLAGRTEETEADEAFVSDYCHTNTHGENGAIIDIACGAWEELIDCCIACPNRCISERFRRCEFFDRMGRGGCCS